jgi:hypothetical protein
VFQHVGLFSPAYPRSEDTELLLRFWLAGYRALYVPGMVVHADVQPERLTKRYHREWHANIGRCNARMGFEELADPVVGLRPEPRSMPRLFGLPLFAVRQLGTELWGWARETVAGRSDAAFLHESRARSLASYIWASGRLHRQGRHRPAAGEVAQAGAAHMPARIDTWPLP